jgi:hypothetical protein
MTAFHKHTALAGFLALAMALPLTAEAQTAKSSGMKQAAAASSTATARWTCVSRAVVEIAPVSFDTSGEASGWVMVQRINGEVIAAERVSGKQVDQLRRLPCGTPDSDMGGVSLVG